MRHKHALSELLAYLKHPRSTYYRHLSSVQDRCQEHKREILAVHSASLGTYGYRRVTSELIKKGIRINHKAVSRLMHELGICGIGSRRRRYSSYKGDVGRLAANKLKRNFKSKRKLAKLVTDITEFKVAGAKLYLSPVMDLYNGEILSYSLGPSPNVHLVESMLDKLYVSVGKIGRRGILHSDQGWHYQMPFYRNQLKMLGLKQSMSRKGNCLDNAGMESFFGILKNEMYYGKDFDSAKIFTDKLNAYMHFYNNKRNKARLKGMSPVEYRAHYE